MEAVHERLRLVASQLASGGLPLSSFVITKQLTKRPEDYPDARAQPHVQVGRRCGHGQLPRSSRCNRQRIAHWGAC